MDVEFVAQTAALESGWHEPNTLCAIQRAQEGGALSKHSAAALSTNYRHLIQIERILRRWSFQAESVLPEQAEPFYRVAIRCGFKTSEEFGRAVGEYRAAIRAEYNKFFGVKS